MIYQLPRHEPQNNLPPDRMEKHLWLFTKSAPEGAVAKRRADAAFGERVHPEQNLARWNWKPENPARETPENLLEHPPAFRAPSEVREGSKKGRGEILILTDDLNVVLSLRQDLLLLSYDLNWTSNFWLAMSYLHNQRFCSLVFDLRAALAEENFVLDFVEEYNRSSKGKRIFLAASASSQALQRLLREQADAVFADVPSSTDLVSTLSLSP